MASWQMLLIFFCTLWTAVTVVQAVDSFESMPESVDGVLIADVGDNISLTCNQTIGIVANWRISSSLDCTGTVVHGVTPEASCDVFNIRALSVSSPYISTAVANASLSMTGSMVECTSVMGQNTVVPIGQSITLCIVRADDPAPPLNLDCQVMSDGVVRCTWSAPASLPNCIMNFVSYNITLVLFEENGTEVVQTRSTTSMDEEFTLVPNVTYQASVVTILDLMPPRQSEAVLTNFTAAATVTTIATTTLLVTTTTDSSSTDQGTTTSRPPMQSQTSGPPFWIWIIIVLVIVGLVIIGIVILIVFRKRIFKLCDKGGKEDTDHIALKQSSGHDSIKHEPAPGGEEYAVVDTTGRSKPTEDVGSFYQDPRAIEHEEAPTGDLYAVTERKPKGSKKTKEPTDEELAQMYSVPDKSKKNQLNYASLDMSGGSGGPVPQQQLQEYATVVN